MSTDSPFLQNPTSLWNESWGTWAGSFPACVQGVDVSMDTITEVIHGCETCSVIKPSSQSPSGMEDDG